jgi:hypothetical protein
VSAGSATQPKAPAQCLDMREVDLPPRIDFGKLMPLGVDQTRVSTYVAAALPYGVRVIAFSSDASEFVPALLSVDSQIAVPTATITKAAIKTAT